MSAQILTTAPHLLTSNTAPIDKIEQHKSANQEKTGIFLGVQFNETPTPLDGSADLSNADFKLSPVGTNLFPNAFNNLSLEFKALCIQPIQLTLSRFYPKVESKT